MGESSLHEHVASLPSSEGMGNMGVRYDYTHVYRLADLIMSQALPPDFELP